MAGAVDVPHGGEREVLADVEVLVAEEQEPFRDEVALHNHQGELLCHLEGESTRQAMGKGSLLPCLWRAGQWLGTQWALGSESSACQNSRGPRAALPSAVRVALLPKALLATGPPRGHRPQQA